MSRGSIIGGVILILVGLFFLLLSLFPDLSDAIDIAEQWPLIIVAVGGLFLLAALIGVSGLAIPGSILAGLGLMMYYQSSNNAWDTWAYSWALIPGFVGVGVFLFQTLEGNMRKGLREGGRLIIISLILFIIFGSFLGGFGNLSFALAFGLIFAGIWILVSNVFLRKQPEKSGLQEIDKEDLD